MIKLPEKHRVLVVDDEPDIYSLTKLSLRGMSYHGRPVEFVQAASGKEAVEAMQSHPETGVILLDVVMETQIAGLDACRTIRQQLGNRLVRILLRTGQPGVAPEKKVIDEYDIDGYLLKTELTTTRLYSSVRTALKGYEDLVELERHRALLKFIHDSAVQLHSFDPLEVALQRILATATTVSDASLGVLCLQTFEESGNPRTCLLHLAKDAAAGEAAARSVADKVAANPASRSLRQPGPFGDGVLIPLVLHRELGHGWIYLEAGSTDDVVNQVLPTLAAHAGNALYSSVAQNMLEAREGPFFDEMTI